MTDATPNKAETAFLLIRENDGSWTATTDLSYSLEVSREATGHDVKTGCREIFEAFAQNDLATAIADRLNPPNAQTTADAIRDALQGRNLATNL